MRALVKGLQPLKKTSFNAASFALGARRVGRDFSRAAGLWDEWRSPDGEIIEICTVLTTSANSVVADLHDRMPVIVTPDKYDAWLDPDVNDFNTIRDILRPYDANLMRRYPVSRRLNNSRIDDAEAASPVTLETPTQGQLF